MSIFEISYLSLLDKALKIGERREDRTGVGTFSLFGERIEVNLADGFPAVTTKRLAFKQVITELLWFLHGHNDVNWLQRRNCHIWDEWAKADGTIGPGYGTQWRSWHTLRTPAGKEVDQIANLLIGLRDNPYGRRHIVSAWNVEMLDQMALPPCHVMFQFYVSQDNRLHCQVYQRSADLFLGVPFNIASYAALTELIAVQLCLSPGRLVWIGGDCHVYMNHTDQVREQLRRQPYDLPVLQINKLTFDHDFKVIAEPDDFVLLNYDHHPAISAPVAV